MSSLDNTVVELSKLAIFTNNTIIEIPIIKFVDESLRKILLLISLKK